MDLLTLFEKFALTLKYHAKLNPKVWHNKKLEDKFQQQLVDTAYEFAKFSGVDKKRIRDMVFTGSNANYNYTKFSDIDVHIVTDISGLSEDALYDKKVKWTAKHKMEHNGYPLEFYIHDQKQNLPDDQGQYSILQGIWVAEPQKIPNAKKILSSPATLTKVQHYIKIVQDLIKGKDNDDDIISFKMKMWKGRTAGLHSGGEFSVENIIYKDLRNRGLIDKLNKKLHKDDPDSD